MIAIFILIISARVVVLPLQGRPFYPALYNLIEVVRTALVVFCFCAATITAYRQRNRALLSWFLLSIGFACWLAADIIYMLIELKGLPPVGSLADIFYELFHYLVAAGILTIPQAQRSQQEKLALVLDITIVVLAGLVLEWGLILLPYIQTTKEFSVLQLINMSHPLGALVALWACLHALFAKLDIIPFKVRAMLSVGLLILFAFALVFAVEVQKGTYVPGNWLGVPWTIALSLCGLGASFAVGVAPKKEIPEQSSTFSRLSGTISVCLAYGCLIASWLGVFVFGHTHPDTITILALIGMLILVGLRQLLGMQMVARLNRSIEEARATLEERVVERTDELFQSQELYRTLVGNIPGAVYRCRCDDLRSVIYVSDAIDGILGRRTQEIMGFPQGLNGIIHPDDRESVQKDIGDAVRLRNAFQLKYRVLDADGVSRWVYDQGQVAATGPGMYVGGVISDITQQRNLEERLQQSQKMESIGQLASGIAHDFNNHLTAIMGNIDLALLVKTPAQIETRLAEAKEAALRAASLTRQFLTFSGKHAVEPRMIDINQVVGQLTKMLVRLIGENINLAVEAQPSLWPVKVDPNHLEQIIINLAVNARDAMLEGGQLRIETRNVFLDENYCHQHPPLKTGEHVMLVVCDTGHGMSPEVRAHVFEPFFTTKPAGKGTGLGLSIVYDAVQHYHGSIEVYSELGSGTCFKIYLPRVAGDFQSQAKDEPAEDISGGNETILLVEDDASVREIATRILQDLGYTVIACTNAEQALQVDQAIAETINLLMTDVVLPGMNGRVLADALRARLPQLKVLYTSGYTESILNHHEVLEQETHFIGKPYSSTNLARKIRHVLDKQN